MKIKHDSNISNKAYNTEFQKSIESTVERIFTTSGLGSIDYLIGSINRSFPGNPKSIIPLTNVGDNEFYLLDKIMNPKIHTIIIRGGLGSGKTSTIKFLTNHIKDELSCPNCKEKSACKINKAFSIYFDLSIATVDRKKPNAALMGIYQGFYKRLNDYVYHYFGDENYIVGFEKYLNSTSPVDENNKRWIAGYSAIKHRINDDDNKEWSSLTSRSKVKEIIEYVERNNKGIESRIESLFDLLIVIRDLYPGLFGCLFIVIDNIDGLPSETQVAASSFFARLASRADIKIIIPVRHSTKSTIIAGNGEITYSVYDHIPPNVCDIIQKRLKHFIDNRNDYNIANWSNNFKQRFIYRVEHVLNLLSGSNRLKDAIKSLSGQSMRRGLSLAERLFLNNVFKYDENNTVEDSYINALLVDKNEKAEIAYDDALVSNIFCDFSNQHNSLICIRILKILLIFKEEKKQPLPLKHLLILLINTTNMMRKQY